MGFIDVNLAAVPDLVVHPTGPATLRVTKAWDAPSKDGNRRNIKLACNIESTPEDGPYATVFENFALPNEEEYKAAKSDPEVQTKIEFMLRRLKDFCIAAGYNFANGIETDELTGLQADASLKEVEQDAFGPDRATVSAWIKPRE